MNQSQTIVRRQTPLQALNFAILRLLRWQITGSFPTALKYLVVGAPHTTNWDFMLMLLLRGATGVNLHWVGKDSLFRWPLGGFLKRLGGIPVNRRIRANFVDQIIDLYNRREELAIAIAPEGTRKKAHYWRSGFYYMALGAQIPIQLVAVDYGRRTLEIGPLLQPSGDIEKDFVLIRRFYAGKQGKFPHFQGEVRLKEETEA